MDLKKFIKLVLSFFILVSGFSSTVFLILNKSSIKAKLSKPLNKKSDVAINFEENEKWANELKKGGYILFFRHAERDKWLDVQMYDALELDVDENNKNGTVFGENKYYSSAVCLSERGKAQAKAMREVIEISNIPIGTIFSSPSCRARQTAELAFGRYDYIDKNLINRSSKKEFKKAQSSYLRNFLLEIPMQPGTNTVISSHNGVFGYPLLLKKGPKITTEEGGFFVISNKDGKLELKHTFKRFLNFSREFFPRNN